MTNPKQSFSNRVRSKKYGSTRLTVLADTAHADAPVIYRIDNDEQWNCSPFSTANIHHNIEEALPLIWKWLQGSAA